MARRKTILAVLGALVTAMLAFPFVANAAMTTFAAHDHGSLDIVIDGQLTDLDQPRFHDLHPEFHIHPGHGNRWHHHPRTLADMFSFELLTLNEALTAMGAEFRDNTLTFDGAVYDTTDPTVTITLRVNGVDVDPDNHVIGDGDHITVEITRP